MAGITLEQAETKLNEYLEAESKILANQSYEFQGRRLNRANLKEVRDGIETWDSRVKELAAKAYGGRRTVVARPR